MFAWLRMGFCEYDICGENLDELSDYEESVALRFVPVSANFSWLWHCFFFYSFPIYVTFSDRNLVKCS
jgi:hypothetical protein